MIMSRLAVYAVSARVSFQQYLAYRANLFFQFIGSFLTTLIAIFLWLSLYRVHDSASIAGYTWPVMLTYLLGVGIIESILHAQFQGDEQMMDIHEGRLNMYLLQPWSPLGHWLAQDMARKAVMFCVAVPVAVLVWVAFARQVQLALSAGSVGLFLLCVLLAAVLHFFIFSTITLAAFWFGLTWGFTFVARVSMGIATGNLVPLTFFPAFWKNLLLFLPFKFFGYVPMQILLGHFSTTQTLAELIQLVLWIGGLLLLWRVIYRRGLHVYGAYGG